MIRRPPRSPLFPSPPLFRSLLDFQRQRLARALRHAAAASPYYRQAIGAAIADGASLADLPVLTKRELMDNWDRIVSRSEEHTSELQSRLHLVCRLLLEKKQQ